MLFSELTSGDDARAERAAYLLGAQGKEALPGLAGLLDSGDADHRWWAVRTLGEMDVPEAAGLLAKALQDPHPAVRQCAARILVDRPSVALIPDLVGCLASTDALLARLAGSALAAAGREAVPVLLEVVEKGPQRARGEAARALAALADPRAVPAFFHAVQNGDSPLVEHWANVGLEKMGIGMAFFKP